MGIFSSGKDKSEELRCTDTGIHVLNADLPNLTNDQLLCVAIARLYQGMMMQDDALIEELYKRGGRIPDVDFTGCRRNGSRTCQKSMERCR